MPGLIEFNKVFVALASVLSPLEEGLAHRSLHLDMTTYSVFDDEPPVLESTSISFSVDASASIIGLVIS